MKHIESGFIIFRHKTLFELSYSVMKSDAIDWILDHLKINGYRAKEWQKLRRSCGYNVISLGEVADFGKINLKLKNKYDAKRKRE